MGSRVMRPRYGSSIYKFVFENTGALLNALIDSEVRRAIADNEPRAHVARVSIDTSDNLISVTVDYVSAGRRGKTTVGFST